MTSLTTPDGIVRWTVSDPASLVAESVAQGDSVQLALRTRQLQYYRWADAAARTAQVGMAYGAKGFQVDTGVEYFYDGTSWSQGARAYVQRDSTNSFTTNVISQYGDSKMAGNNTASRAVNVVFPQPFAAGTVPMVVISLSGQKANGVYDPTNAGVTSTTVSMASYSPTNTGFVAHLRISTGSLATATDYYYTWYAVGVVA